MDAAQEAAIRKYVKTDLLPLIERVLVKRIGLAADFIVEELERQKKADAAGRLASGGTETPPLD